jgi:uncharacterized protein involved in type VI secretion and phage assembly
MSGAIDVLSITTPLPDTSFTVSGVSGEERLSRPYSYTVALHSGTALLDPNSLLGRCRHRRRAPARLDILATFADGRITRASLRR